MFWGIGFNEYLGGKKKSNIPATDKKELKTKILNLNYPDLPYGISLSKKRILF